MRCIGHQNVVQFDERKLDGLSRLSNPIDLHSYAKSGAITAKSVLNVMQVRVPDSSQLFAETTDNFALARLAADALSGFSGNVFICHMILFCVK